MAAKNAPANDPQPTRVGIALVTRAGCYLIRQRPPLPGSPMPGFWEFPGGKCEAGEAPQQAAVRECWEEASLTVVVRAERRVIVHHYPHGLVELHYFDAAPVDASADPAAGSGFVWVPAAELGGYQFPEANGSVLAALLAEAARGASANDRSHSHVGGFSQPV